MPAYRAVRFLQTRVVQDARAGTPDETRYDKDSVHVLPERSAQHWIKRGAAEAIPMPVPQLPEVPPPPPEVPLPGSSEDQESDDSDDITVADAIAELEPGNPDHWTAAGKPSVTALSVIMGRTVTGAERDAAMKDL